jgi:predicted signal transduction protein with EAL and GGDEF domain
VDIQSVLKAAQTVAGELVAERLNKQVRDGDTFGRLGGDEFVLLMEGELGMHDLTAVAEKLLAAFRKPFRIDNHDLYPTVSLGISLYPDDASDADKLLRNADAAMYRAKQQGRNTYQFFSADLAVAAAERLTLEHDLRRAIEQREFELYFQPQVALASGRVVGAEALIRWNHPERGLLMPDNFIPIAEEIGIIIAIGEWVLKQACRHLEQWRCEEIALSRLAVNISGSQFGWHGGFAAPEIGGQNVFCQQNRGPVSVADPLSCLKTARRSAASKALVPFLGVV